MLIWDEEHECCDRSKLEAIQLKRLKNTVRHVWDNVPHYRQAFANRGLEPGDIHSLSDLAKLPFTSKDDLRDHYPYGLFAVPLERVNRIHSSSGTTGKPTVVGYTRQDLDTWTELIARIVCQAGVEPGDIAQICFGYGLFTGGFGLHYGLERVGCGVIPASSGNSEKQIMIMQDFGSTVLISTPTYALYLAEVARNMGVDPVGDLDIRLGLFGGEQWTDEMRREIEERWGLTATDNYGLSEVMGPGVAGECLEKNGLHIAEDHFIAEIIDPDTGEVLPHGAEGELVFTSLTKEAFPVIRYRTKDISRLIPESCGCGRTGLRMEKVNGRTDDMLTIRGVNVFPSQIESVLLNCPELSPHYQVIVERRNHMDQLSVEAELKESVFSDSFKKLEEITEKVERKLATVLSLRARVKLVEPHSLKRSTGKAQRVIDNREISD